jgi:hypothetical protein
MEYVVCKAFKGPDGPLEPGAVVDADNWRNVAAMVRERYLRPLEEQGGVPGVDLDALADAVAERLKPTIEALLEAHRMASPPPAPDLDALAAAVAERLGKKDKR